jgi:hypothetical protein
MVLLGPSGQGIMNDRSSIPKITCPFCGGHRFDHGREIFAAGQPALYCRKSPPQGKSPDPDLSLKLKGSVCLDCGFVAMMVDVRELHAPIARGAQAAMAMAATASATAPWRDPEEQKRQAEEFERAMEAFERTLEEEADRARQAAEALRRGEKPAPQDDDRQDVPVEVALERLQRQHDLDYSDLTRPDRAGRSGSAGS